MSTYTSTHTHTHTHPLSLTCLVLPAKEDGGNSSRSTDRVVFATHEDGGKRTTTGPLTRRGRLEFYETEMEYFTALFFDVCFFLA